jgi:hypothetical protein
MDIIRKKMKNLITNAYILSKEDFLLGAFFYHQSMHAR